MVVIDSENAEGVFVGLFLLLAPLSSALRKPPQIELRFLVYMFLVFCFLVTFSLLLMVSSEY